MAVLKLPGSITITRTPNGSSSRRRLSEMASRANLDAAYGPMNGNAPRPAIELMLTIRPRDALRSGRNAWVTAKAPTRFTSRTRRSSSSGNSSSGPAAGIPALFTSPSSGAPASARSTCSLARAMLAVSVTSIRTGVTPSRASATSSSARRTVPNTRKPRPARCRAMAAPMPVEAPVTTTPPFTPGNLRTLLRNPVHGAAPRQHVQLAPGVLPEGQDAPGVDVGAPKRPARDGPIRVPGAPQPALAIIREEVLARERLETSTAIHEPTDDGAAVRVGVLEHRQHEPGGAARVRVVAVRPFHDPPAVIQTAPARRLDVHLLPTVLAHVPDVEQAARRIEGEAPRISQTQGPDLGGATARRKRIVHRNGIRVAVIHVDPQQLAEQRVGVLRTVLRIAPRAPVAHPDVQHPVGPEQHEPAVVVCIRLRNEENELVGRRSDRCSSHRRNRLPHSSGGRLRSRASARRRKPTGCGCRERRPVGAGRAERSGFARSARPRTGAPCRQAGWRGTPEKQSRSAPARDGGSRRLPAGARWTWDCGRRSRAPARTMAPRIESWQAHSG